MQKQLTQKKLLSDHSRFYDQNISTVNLDTEDSNSNPGKVFLTSLFHRLCKLVLTVIDKKDTNQQKKSRKKAVNKKSLSKPQNSESKATHTKKASLRSQ